MNPFFKNSQPFIPPFQRCPNFAQLPNAFPFPPPNYVANDFIRNTPAFQQNFPFLSPPNLFNTNFQTDFVPKNFSQDNSINENNYQDIPIYPKLNRTNGIEAVSNTENLNWIHKWVEINKVQLFQPQKQSFLTILQFRKIIKAIFKINQACETIQSCLSRQQLKNITKKTSQKNENDEKINECVCYTLGECKYNDVKNKIVITVELSLSHLDGSTKDEGCSMHLHETKLKDLEAKMYGLKDLVNDDAIKDVKKKIGKRFLQKKRKKLKKQEKITNIRIKNEKVDMWLEKLQKAEEVKKKQREVKEKADEVMLEVRKKINDVRRCMKVVKGLRKVRSLRVKNRAAIEAHKQTRFDKQMNSLDEMMRDQLDSYKLEEKTLQVMMESEDRENEKKEEKTTLSNMKLEMETYRQTLKQHLFGAKGSEVEGFLQCYSHNGDVSTLIRIRREWDEYLTEKWKEGYTEPSSLPPSWVTPSPPCNQAWKQFLTKQST